ncbi:unnamed protein product [Durusdinium trenchii]|uniref:Uncharacterized protein n=1 Tax=Durusdinium trenchii TaxID=1381693 RepID=A0ABP0MTI4_9DINO
MRSGDNEADPEKSSLDWLNLNAFGSKAIQGAIDRVRASTLGGAAEPEVAYHVLLPGVIGDQSLMSLKNLRSAEPSNVSEDALKIIAEEEDCSGLEGQRIQTALHDSKESEKKAIEAVQRKGSDDSQDSTRHVKPQKDSEKTTRLPMPTPLMAATASAKRAEPPPMVVKTEKISQDTVLASRVS